MGFSQFCPGLTQLLSKKIKIHVTVIDLYEKDIFYALYRIRADINKEGGESLATLNML